MPLVPLLPIFHRFNREFFSGSLVKGVTPLVSLRWSDGRLRNTAGFYRTRTNGFFQKSSEIVLSRPILEKMPQRALHSTLCHEMIHAWVDLVLKVHEVHGPNFYERMKLINSMQSQFEITIRHSFPIPRTSPKWRAICPACGLIVPYKRRMQGVACKACCDNRYGGKWHPSCLLDFVLFES